MSLRMVSCVALLVLAATSLAHAEPVVTATFSPVHLVLPVVEVNVEGRVAPHVGVSVIAGAGKVTDQGITATVIEGGAQGSYYFLRPFSGVHAGVEAIYLHLGDVDIDNTATAAGLAIGPYVGYKIVTHVGFTAVFQLGVDFLAVKAKNDSSSGNSAKTVSPLLNINLGWSF